MTFRSVGWLSASPRTPGSSTLSVIPHRSRIPMRESGLCKEECGKVERLLNTQQIRGCAGLAHCSPVAVFAGPHSLPIRRLPYRPYRTVSHHIIKPRLAASATCQTLFQQPSVREPVMEGMTSGHIMCLSDTELVTTWLTFTLRRHLYGCRSGPEPSWPRASRPNMAIVPSLAP
ncbi:hypothetical protein LZ30DRAFT_345553 [Colletotrichum cereale]|nr:hypothetical protein LZ30DRAFT_345553 [Colletotrichum cereale]